MRADDRPRDFPSWMRWVEAQLRQLRGGSGPFFKIGQETLTFDGSGNSTLTHGFGQTPVVVFATTGVNLVICPAIGTITDTQVVLHARQLDGTVYVGDAAVLWQVGV